jgi:HrpA-like RNA helicase
MVVKTGTGSGKSTVLPPFILGLGYKKVYVTQPRRLPCKRICQRIATTNGNDVVGYRLGGGVAKNP